MDDLLSSLTDAQRQAATHIEGPLLMLAGPGSGKTRVVTHRIAYMLQQGVPAYQIAALTFTNKAADEMRLRLEILAPNQSVWMGTFHRFCARLLRQYAPMIGLAENYSIYDTSDAKQALKRAIESADVSTSHTSPEKIAAVISRAKNRLITPEMMEGQRLRHDETIAARVYPIYQKQLRVANAVDFDDLLLHVARLLQENPELRQDLDRRYRYILVDEYQDTNLAQYAIVRSLSIDYPNLSVTGDPDQSIYGWRGADLNNILDFEKDYPAVTTVRLETNYRSTPNILRAADLLIHHNTRRKAKKLVADRQEGESVVLRLYDDGLQEADDIADQIAYAITEQEARPRDFAILCRMNALTRALEHAFRSRGLPYQIVNGLEFYKRKEVKDLLAYLHLINNASHDVALMRIINTPARGIGKKTVERLSEYADQRGLTLLESARRAGLIPTLPARSAAKVAKFVAMYDRLSLKATATLEDLLKYVIEETEYRPYLAKHATEDQDKSPDANVDEFVAGAVEFDRQHPEDGSLDAFLEQVALVSDTDAWEETDDRVAVMTMHAAKGLEFPHVFIIAVEDNLLPHARSKEDPNQVEEERRLLFVGMTRAQDRLQLSYCKRRSMRGERSPAVGSPFLMELPREEMRQVEPDDSSCYFDSGGDEFGDDEFGYPDSWDLPEETAPEGTDDFADEICQLPPEERADSGAKRASASATSRGALPAGLITAANLLDQRTSASANAGAFKEGMVVTHPEYGSGRIVALTGRGPKRTAKIDFFSGESSSFRVAFVNLTIEEER